jgi:hypothetical protein
MSASGVISGTPTAAGTYAPTVKVTGNDGASSTSQIGITISPAPDFTVSVSPTMGRVTPYGDTVHFTVTIHPNAAFQQNFASVWLDVTMDGNAPLLVRWNSAGRGAVCVGSPDWSADLSASAVGNPYPTSWLLNISARNFDNSVHHGYVANLVIANNPDSDFTVLVTPPAAPITAGQSGVYTARVNAVNGFYSGTSMTLAISNLPAGASASPASLTLLADGSARSFTVSTSTTTPSGNFLISGTGGGKNHDIWQSLATQPASLSLSAFPSSQAITTTGTANFAVAARNAGGTVTLSVSGLPACASISGPMSVVAGGLATLTLHSAGCPPGSYPITITGTAGNLSDSAVVSAAVHTGTIAAPDIDIWYNSEIVALDTGEVFAYFATWCDGPDAPKTENQLVYPMFSVNGKTSYLVRDGYLAVGDVTFGSTPSFVSSIAFTLGDIGFGDYTFKFNYAQACCSDNGYSWIQWPHISVPASYPSPNLTQSPSPAYGVPGQAYDGVVLTGTGLGIADADNNLYRGVTSINISGNGCPDPSTDVCGITASPQYIAVENVPDNAPVPAATSVQALITIAPNAKSGLYQLSVTAFGQETNTVNFTVVDQSPIIDYVTQQPIQPGQQGSISVYGSNFGPSCGNNLPCPTARISLCDSNAVDCSQSQSGSVTPTVTFWSDTRIDAQVYAAPATEGSYDVQVTSAGAAGLGFTEVPQISKSSNRKPITVAGNPNLGLQVSSNGTVLNQRDCAYIDATPSMPQITVRIVTVDGSPVSGNAAWQLKTTFKQTMPKGTPPIPESNTTPQNPATVAANQPWNIQFDSQVFGGNAVLEWTYNDQKQIPFSFRICGTNPDFDTLRKYISDNVPYFFAWKTALHETNASQFCEQYRQQSPNYCSQSANWGWPVFGPPAGYGIMQLDPAPSQDSLWNWQAAVLAAKDRLDSLAGTPQYGTDSAAYHFWIRQVRQWNLYNGPRTPQARVAPPPDQDESTVPNTCRFTLPLDKPWDDTKSSTGLESPGTLPNGTYWFGDAILLRQYGGAITKGCLTEDLPPGLIQACANWNLNYIVWKNSNLSPGTKPHWNIWKENIVSANTVYEVCSCTVPNASCTRLPPTYGIPPQ